MACGNVLFNQENVICTKCLFHLPRTNFCFFQENPVFEIFKGRIDIFSATSFLFFNKGGKVQKLMHNLKYRGKKDVGIFLGTLLGRNLVKSPLFNTVDIVVPVPLHPLKRKKRGYNQSALIARGISDVLNIETIENNLIKIANTESQTKKKRFDRWENVKTSFIVKDKSVLKNKHILLVDDVITTGATIEACVTVLKELENVKVSVASVAYAQG